MEWSTCTVAVYFGACWMLFLLASIVQFVDSRRTDTYSRVPTSDVSDVELSTLGNESDENGKAKHVGPVGGGEKVIPAPTPAGSSDKITAMELTLPSVKLMLREASEFGLILLYTWLCENQPIHPHGKKWHDYDFFWFVFLIFLAYGLMDIRKCKPDVLNRDQTEEWKGWMQYLFLAYHYFHYNEIYNSVRVFVSCYVWMTGFGNFSFFYMKNDFSFLRFWNMQWRLNFLVMFLCLTHSNTYILYYICPLHTFYFCMVYVSMRIGKSVNYTKWTLRIKLALLAILIFLIWEIPTAFDYAFAFLSTTPNVGAPGGTRKEFHFRTSLDHWSTYFGMLFALNFPMYQAWTKQIETLDKVPQLFAKGAVAAVFIAASVWWVKDIYSLPKIEYNEVHPFYFMIPVLTYILLRNITPYLRSFVLHNWKEMGKITLETYLMQHHIWLTSNAKTLLVWFPDSPKINLFVITVVYMLVAKRLYRLTVSLRARLIPEHERSAVMYLLVMLASLLIANALGAGVHAMEAEAISLMGASFVLAGMAVAFFSAANNNTGKTGAIALASLTVVAIITSIIYHHTLTLEGPPPLTSSPTPAPQLGQADGIAQDVGHGFVTLLGGMLILFLMDNFFGLQQAVMCMLSMVGMGSRVSYEQAYGALLERITGTPR